MKDWICDISTGFGGYELGKGVEESFNDFRIEFDMKTTNMGNYDEGFLVCIPIVIQRSWMLTLNI